MGKGIFTTIPDWSKAKLDVIEGNGLSVCGSHVSMGRTIKAGEETVVSMYQDGQKVYITDWDKNVDNITINVSGDSMIKNSMMSIFKNKTNWIDDNAYIESTGSLNTTSGAGWWVHKISISNLKHDGYVYFENMLGDAPCCMFTDSTGNSILSIEQYASRSTFSVPIPSDAIYLWVSYYHDGGYDGVDVYVKYQSSKSVDYTLDTSLEPPVALFTLFNGMPTYIKSDADITIQYGESLPAQIEKVKEMSEPTVYLHNMRYTPDTDMVEIYYNGEWHPWKSGNLQTVYIYRDGEQVVPLDNSGAYYHNSNFPHRGYWTLNEDHMAVTYTNSNAGVYAIGTTEMFDFSNYTKVYIEVDYGGTTQRYEMSTNSRGLAYLSWSVLMTSNTYSFRIYLSTAKASITTSDYNQFVCASGTTAAYKTAIVRKIWVE